MQSFFNWTKKHLLAILCSITFATTLFALIAPWLFTINSDFIAFNSDTGVIGDTFGIMNPFVAIAAALITFIAFWTQYQANQEMQKNTAHMQLERQFYEMLKIHYDNVRNLHAEAPYTDPVSGHQTQKIANGHDYFSCILEEFNLIYSTLPNHGDSEDTFYKAYRIFFFGINPHPKNTMTDTANLFRNLISQKSNTTFWQDYPKLAPLADSLFKGHMDQLVTYYRHLFLLVKTIVQFNEDLFSYADKRQFLRILRAQLSSAEQVLLYYNWKSGCGEQWEEDSSKPNGNHFFTDYRMIHNIIPKDYCQVFGSDKILQSLLVKNPDYRKLNNEDTLFELIDEKKT